MTTQQPISQPKTLKERVYRLVEPVSDATPIEKSVDYLLLTMIVVSILMFILATVQSLYEKYDWFFKGFEVLAVAVFTLEYIAHLYTCTINSKYKGALWGRMRYALTFMMLIDLLAILPSYLLFLGGELAILRTVRLIRLARIIKVDRYSSALTSVQAAWVKKAPQLFVSVSMLLGLIIIASSLLYAAEVGHHDGEYFTSIPDAMWATVATVTPLGHNNYYPKTQIGQFLMIILSIFGIAFVALPSGIFASAFSDQLSDDTDAPIAAVPPTATSGVPTQIVCECPHCSHPITIQVNQ